MTITRATEEEWELAHIKTYNITQRECLKCPKETLYLIELKNNKGMAAVHESDLRSKYPDLFMF